LRDLDQAISRLAEGSYGMCRNCGCTIGKERLEALPMAELCMSCAMPGRSSIVAPGAPTP
jgi:RNA polymerase-binding transcription factor DksA